MTCTPEPARRRHGLIAALLLVAIAGCAGPAEREAPLGRAQEALARGDGVAAEAALRDALDAGVPQPELAASLGRAELLQNDLLAARQWLGPEKFSAESQGEGYSALGELEYRAGNLPASGRAFDKALAAGGESIALWVAIARLRYRGGEQLQAIEAADRALALGPDDPAALELRAQLLRDAGDMPRALALLDRALALAPDDSNLLVERASTLGDLGQARAALRDIRRLTELAPKDQRAFYLQAVIAARGGDFRLARTLLLRSGEIERRVPAAILLSAITDLENGNPEAAASQLSRLRRLQPDNARVTLLLARALAAGGANEELVYRFAIPARRDSAAPYLQLLVGRAYEQLGDRRTAALYLDAAARPRDSLALVPIAPDGSLDGARSRGAATPRDALMLVRGLVASGQGAEAVRVAEANLARAPGSFDALLLAGDAALVGGGPSAALAHYRRAAEIRLSWPLVERLLAVTRRTGEGDAERLLAAYAARAPMDGVAARELARLRLARGELAASAEPAARAIRLRPRDPAAWALRADQALAAGQASAAETYARRAFRLHRADPAIRRTLASALEAAGAGNPAAPLNVTLAQATRGQLARR